MIHIDVNIDTSDLEAAISRLREKAQDTTPIMRRCADVLAGAAEGAFDDEADGDGRRSGSRCGLNGGGRALQGAFRQNIAAHRKSRLFA